MKINNRSITRAIKNAIGLDQWATEFQDGINSDYKRSLIK